jgi:integrase
MESRKNGPVERWVAQIYVDGQKRRVLTATEAQARRELRKLMRSVDDGKPVSDGNLTLGVLMREWDTKVLATRDLAPSTIERHRWALKILREDLGGVKVRSLTPDRVERAFATRAEAGLARASILKVRGTLSQVLKWAVRRDLVARNIATVVELPSTARPAKEGRSLTPAQARKFLGTAAGTPLEAMWTAMLYLGLRPGEAAGLAWTDIDFDAKTIHIWRSLSRTATGAAMLTDTKTPQSVRSLDAPKPVLDALRRRRTEQQEQRLAAGSIWRNEHDLVFTSPTGHPIDAAACRRELTSHRQARWSRSVEAERAPPLRRIPDVRRWRADRAGRRSARTQRPPHAPEALPPPDPTNRRRWTRAG